MEIRNNIFDKRERSTGRGNGLDFAGSLLYIELMVHNV